jgi:hypothetical protein
MEADKGALRACGRDHFSIDVDPNEFKNDIESKRPHGKSREDP